LTAELRVGLNIRDLFKDEEIKDILFVITYSGRTPERI